MNDVLTVIGSWGHLNADARTGRVLDCRVDDFDEGGYSDILRFDVDEWRAAYPGEDPQSRSIDILDLGLWTKTGLYDPPEPDFRGEADARIACD